MTQNQNTPESYVTAIKASGLSIYDEVPIGHPTLWIPTPQLEQLLQNGLQGISLDGLPLRTRSKVVKESVCRVLGYPTPKSFKNTAAFPGAIFRHIYPKIEQSTDMERGTFIFASICDN